MKLLRIQIGGNGDGCFSNFALAIRFSGRRIGTAFAIMAASNVMVYELYDISQMLTAWALVSIFFVVAVSLLSFVADKIIFRLLSNRRFYGYGCDL